MPYKRSTFYCCKCRRGYADYDEARRCEGDHIVSDALASFEAKIAAIMKRPTNPQEPTP